MIKIFSIKEIVDASEKILNSSNHKISKNLNLNNKQKKLVNHPKSFDEPLILEKELEKTKEPANNQNSEIEDKQSSKVITNVENNSDRQEIINELYMLFNKKVKKNTIKIIIDQQKEIKELRYNLSELRKKDYQNLKLNKELRNKILDLVNNEKILNLKITQIQSKLDSSIEKETELKNINKNLEADLIEMKKSFTSIKEINMAIESSKSKLQIKIDDLISYQTKLEDSNKINENNLLILTNTKNSLFNENEKLKNELKLMSENKEMLISNNVNLQNETSLLLKNKKLLIEINDRYQKELDELKIAQNDTQEENSAIANELRNIINENQQNIKNNLSLEKQNNDFKNKIDLIYLN